jgi:hypothetical protein
LPIRFLESYCFSSQVSFRVQYPQDYHDLSHEDRKEFKQTRYGNDQLYGIAFVYHPLTEVHILHSRFLYVILFMVARKRATSSCLSAFHCENLPDNVNQNLVFAEPMNRFIPLRQLLER